MRRDMEKVMDQVEIDAVVKNEEMSKSAKIKALFDMGYEVKEIAEKTGIIYNMCYNVLTNYIITQGINVVKEKKESKKDVIWTLFDKGLANMDVARETQTNYNYVCKLKKEWKMQPPKGVEPVVHEEVAATAEVKEENVEVAKELAPGVTLGDDGKYYFEGKQIGKRNPLHPEHNTGLLLGGK